MLLRQLLVRHFTLPSPPFFEAHGVQVQFSRLSTELLCQILSSIAFTEQDPYLIRATNRTIQMAYDDGCGVWHLICQGKGLQGLNPHQARQRCNEYLRAPLLEALETLKPGCVGAGSEFMRQGQMYQLLDLSFGKMSCLPASKLKPNPKPNCM